MAFFSRINIESYRGIENLKIEKLKRINLIVGDNNCGKTSVLEAIELFRSSGNMANVYKVARQRESIAFMNSNSYFDSFICMFPKTKDNHLSLSVSGILNRKKIEFSIDGVKDRILLDAKDQNIRRNLMTHAAEGEVEADAFHGSLYWGDGVDFNRTRLDINQYSPVTGTTVSSRDKVSIVYVSPFEHLRGNVISGIVRNEAYKEICIKALQLFDPDIEDMLIFRSDTGNRPVEYLRHKKTGDMPISNYGDGIKKVLALSNAIAQAADGILLIDEIETAIHKKYYDDIFGFIVKACNAFNVQAFVTTHSIEAIDGLLATQKYEKNTKKDDICVCTIKRTEKGSFSRILTGREVHENREAFGFEVRL